LPGFQAVAERMANNFRGYIFAIPCNVAPHGKMLFTHESSYCFQRILAIAILSVRSSVCHTGRSVKNGAS